ACASNVRQQIEVLIVIVLSALPLPNLFLRFDELDPFDLLDHLVAKLVLDAQAKRRPVNARPRLAVHLTRENACRLQHVLQPLGVVIRTAVQRLAKGEEGDDLRRWKGSNEPNQVRHRDAAPLRDARPSLDAVMHRDLFDESKPPQIPTNPQIIPDGLVSSVPITI